MDRKTRWLQELGQRIFRARAAKDWTQRRLANESGISPNHVARIERGEREPSATTLLSLAEALGVTTDSLLGR